MLGKLFCLFAFLAILFPGMANAAGTLTDCAGTTITSTHISQGAIGCWVYTGDDESPAFYFKGKTNFICLDPNIATEGVATTKVFVRNCHLGSKPGSSPENQCFKTHTVALDGFEGDDDVQRNCKRVGPGTYYGEMDTAAGGETAVMSFRSE